MAEEAETNERVKFSDERGRESQDGKWEDEVKGKEDKALLNLITQTAKKSSYNNSRRHGLGTIDDDKRRARSVCRPEEESWPIVAGGARATWTAQATGR